MYGYATQESFIAGTYSKAKYKPKKIEGKLSLTVNKIIALSNAVKQFNEDFARLNNEMCSNKWSEDSATISKITEDISEKLSSIGQALVQDITDQVQKVNTNDEKTSMAIDDIKGRLATNLETLQGIR